MKFEIIGQPQGKQRAKVSTYRGFARAYTPEKTVAYENLIKLSFIESGGKIIPKDTSISMTLTAVYQIPKSFSKKKAAAALLGEIKPLTKPDIDNVIKVVCDALNGVAYKDDTQITSVTAIKYYGEQPKITVYLEEGK